MTTYLVAWLCVVGMAVGQILFKLSSSNLSEGGLLSTKTAIPLLAAIVLYGITSLAWVWVLQRADLGRIYPVMAMAFVLVPVASHLVFGERFSPQYVLGVALIVVGIIVAVKA